MDELSQQKKSYSKLAIIGFFSSLIIAIIWLVLGLLFSFNSYYIIEGSARSQPIPMLVSRWLFFIIPMSAVINITSIIINFIQAKKKGILISFLGLLINCYVFYRLYGSPLSFLTYF